MGKHFLQVPCHHCWYCLYWDHQQDYYTLPRSNRFRLFHHQPAASIVPPAMIAAPSNICTQHLTVCNDCSMIAAPSSICIPHFTVHCTVSESANLDQSIDTIMLQASSNRPEEQLVLQYIGLLVCGLQRPCIMAVILRYSLPLSICNNSFACLNIHT